MTRYMRRLLAAALAVMLLLAPTTAYASGFDMSNIYGDKNGDNGMSGGAKYISDAYRDNYYLDIEELGIMDIVPKTTSMLANLLFGLSKIIVDISIRIFYITAEFSLADFMQDTLDDAQTSLKTNIFDELMPFAVMATLLYMSMLIVKRNGQALAGQLMQFLAISLTVTLLTTNTALAVSLVDDLTQAISSQIVAAVYGLGNDADDKSYIQTVAGSMWDTMVHQPWVMFNLEGDDSLAHELLQLKPNNTKRAEVIKKYTEDPRNTLFLKDKPMSQLPMLLLYIVPVLLKCGIYVCIGLLQLAFRIFTIILALMGVLILFLALFPQLGGSVLVGSWLRKILSTQLNIVLLSLLLGVIMLIDKALYNWLWDVPMGWLLVMASQAGVSIIIFLSREQLIGISKMMSKAVSNPSMVAHTMQRAVNRADFPILNTTQAAGDRLQKTIHTQKINFKERLSQRADLSSSVAPHSSRVSASATTPGDSHSYNTATDVITPAPVHRPVLYSSVQQQAPMPTATAAASPRPRLTQERRTAPPPHKSQLGQQAQGVDGGHSHGDTPSTPRADVPRTRIRAADGGQVHARPQLAPPTLDRGQAAPTTPVAPKTTVTPQMSAKPTTTQARPLLSEPEATAPRRSYQRQQPTAASIAPPQPKRQKGA